MFHFISGLPRSGSSLLASILNQNPACSAGVMSPVGRVVTQALEAMGSSNEAEGFITNEQRRSVLLGIFNGYYDAGPHEPAPVVFDNNRRWCANVALLADLFPDAKIVCCLRSPAAICDSFERLFQQNPLNLSVAYGGRSNTTIYERIMEIMGSNGVVGYALNAFRSAYFSEFRDRLVLINYDDMARFPAAVMNDLTNALKLPVHNYDFDNISQLPGVEAFDRELQTPGLHALLPKVVYEPRPTILPPDIFNSMPPAFWLGKEEVTAAR